MSGSRGRRIAINAGLAAASLALTLGALELGFRLLLGDDYLIGKQILTFARRHHHAAGNRGADCFPTNPSGVFHEVDPVRWKGALLLETMHYQPIPRAMLRHTPWCVEFTNNRSGFRGADFANERRPGSLRVVVLGDSFAYGVGVADTETLAVQLETALAERGPSRDVEVINLGEPGIDTSRQLAHWHEHRKLRPDVVVLAYVLNDVSRAEGVGERNAAADLVMLRPGHLETGGWRGSALVRFVSHRLARRRAHDGTLAGYLEAFDAERNAEGLAETEARLGELAREVAADGAELLVALYPILYRLGDDYPLAPAHETLGAIFDRLDLAWIDLRTDAFAGQPAEALHVHPLDHHPNALAHGLAARAIADEMARRGLSAVRNPNADPVQH
ncbi:MAG: GDSL-type esterase/lipase family protein [Myxococcota bacterium]